MSTAFFLVEFVFKHCDAELLLLFQDPIEVTLPSVFSLWLGMFDP
jgi:hypothetical protein